MKKGLLSLLACIALITHAAPYKVIGRYDRHPDGRISVLLLDGTPSGLEFEVAVSGGRFTITGDIPHPMRMIIDTGIGQEIWIEPGEQEVVIAGNRLTVSGSKTNEEAMTFGASLEGKTREEITDRRREFVEQHPASYYSPEALRFLIYNEELPMAENLRLYNRLDEQVRLSAEGRDCKRTLDKQLLTVPGSPAPPFSAPEGSPDKDRTSVVSNAIFEGKVVLMDFWAHWCVPCRQGIPVWKQFYREHKDEGFDLLFVNFDLRMDSVAWQQAIREEQIEPWHQVNSIASWNPQQQDALDIYANYFVQRIPRYVLIDRRGIVRGTWTGASRDNYEEIKALAVQLLGDE